MQTGFMTAVPYALNHRHPSPGHISDRMNERRWEPCRFLLLYGGRFAAAGLMLGSYWSIAGISLGVVGLYALNAIWPLPVPRSSPVPRHRVGQLA